MHFTFAICVGKTLDSNLIAIMHNICIILDSRMMVIHYASQSVRTLSCLVRVDMRATGLNCQARI